MMSIGEAAKYLSEKGPRQISRAHIQVWLNSPLNPLPAQALLTSGALVKYKGAQAHKEAGEVVVRIMLEEADLLAYTPAPSGSRRR